MDINKSGTQSEEKINEKFQQRYQFDLKIYATCFDLIDSNKVEIELYFIHGL
jgi:hypothetical protein